jgi:tetratricopeptide (TPR) repeat protein
MRARGQGLPIRTDFSEAGDICACRDGCTEKSRMAVERALEVLGRFEQALQLARRAVERDPLNPRSYRLQGHLALSAARLDGALTAGNWALELNPEGPITHIQIGSVYLSAGTPTGGADRYGAGKGA